MKAKNLKARIRDNLTYVFFTGPATLLFCAFVLVPLVLALYYSLHDWNGISINYNFIGFKNYTKVFSETAFLKSFGFTFSYMLVSAITLNGFGLLVALALNTNLKLRTALRGAYFMPMVISAVVVGYLWNIIIVRLFPYLGQATGLAVLQKNWFSYPDTAFASLIIASLWQSFGYYMLLYLTGLQSVPSELTEAAAIDGANSFQRFIRVTVPMMRPTFTTCIFLSIIGGLKAFDLTYSLTGGGPFGSTTSIALQIYLDAYKRDLLSYASAKAIIFCLIIVVLTFVQVALMQRKEVEA